MLKQAVEATKPQGCLSFYNLGLFKLPCGEHAQFSRTSATLYCKGKNASRHVPVPVSEFGDHRHGPACYRTPEAGKDYRQRSDCHCNRSWTNISVLLGSVRAEQLRKQSVKECVELLAAALTVYAAFRLGGILPSKSITHRPYLGCWCKFVGETFRSTWLRSTSGVIDWSPKLNVIISYMS